MTTSEEFETNHLDRITCLHINHDGTKILTGSIDHRIKVWSVSPQTQQRTLIETFGAHDADIRDAKWLHPSTGSHLGTIGNDLKFHLWGEELTQAPNSGRRFRRLFTINSPTRVPFVSLDFRNVDNVYTYLAIIDRQGLLSVYEPTNPDEFRDWTLVDRWNVVVPVPGRGEQSSFRVRWDQNVMPLPYVCGVSEERKQLSLVVTAGNEVKVYRGVVSETKSQENDASGPDGEASHRIVFYEAFKLPPHPALIRDVQWAPFNVRGTDLFATACKDGAVRIFEMSVSELTDTGSKPPNTGKSSASEYSANHSSVNDVSSSQTKPRSPTAVRQQSSNLTSAIAGGRQAAQQQQQQQQSQQPAFQPSQPQSQPQPQSSQRHDPRSPNPNSNPNQSTATIIGPTATSTTNVQQNPNPNLGNSTGTQPLSSATHIAAITRHTAPRNTHSFPYKSSVSLIANLEHAHSDAWTVSWEPQGQVLVSGGADGTTKIWRRSTLDLGYDLGGSTNGENGGDVGGAAGSGGGGGQGPHGLGLGLGLGVGLGNAGGGGRWMLFADQAVSLGDEGQGADTAADDVDYD